MATLKSRGLTPHKMSTHDKAWLDKHTYVSKDPSAHKALKARMMGAAKNLESVRKVKTHDVLKKLS